MFQGLGKSQGSHKAPKSLGKAARRIRYFLRGLGEAYRVVPLTLLPSTFRTGCSCPLILCRLESCGEPGLLGNGQS